MMIRFAVLLGLFFSVAQAIAETRSDIAKEQRWSEQVIDTLFTGEPVWLEAEGHRFLGLHTEASNGDKRKGLILAHGIGIHPNWEQVIQPLRVALSEQGWNTLSIQMPVLANEAKAVAYAPLFKEVPGRFESAISYLERTGVEEIVIVGHSMGAEMISHYLSTERDHPITGTVLIGLSAGDDGAPIDVLEQLEKIELPVLDLFGSDDLANVMGSIEARKLAGKRAGNESYVQQEVAGANHFFDGMEDELVERVSRWVDTLNLTRH